MVRVTSKKKRKTRRLYGLIFLIFLSAAAGVGLFKLSPSLLDIGRIFRLAADKILEQSADTESAEPVLRGTVFDRNLNELAISYRLYSLYVRPTEITDARDVVRILADVTGLAEDHLHVRLNEANSIIKVAEHLEQSQVDMIKNAMLPGLYIKPVEERFYPLHETAANLVGFIGKGIGLDGVEGEFDMLLQDGEFRTDSITGIDFNGEKVLGRKQVDVVLTIDLEIQNNIEKQLKDYLSRSNASRGVALLMNTKTGEILARVSQPSFNPNYYWRFPDSKRESLFNAALDPQSLRSLKLRVAAIRKNGDAGDFPPPETVAKYDYGLTPEEIEELGQIVRDGDGEVLPSTSGSATGSSDMPVNCTDGCMTGPVQWAAGLAGLFNGGWEVSPYILDAVYDHSSAHVFSRSDKVKNTKRILSPSMGIRVKHDLAAMFAGNNEKALMQVESVARTYIRDGKSEHVMQEIFAGAIPARSPEMMLFIVTQQDELYPFPARSKSPQPSIRTLGKDILLSMHTKMPQTKASSRYVASSFPVRPDEANYDQFLISSRMDFQDRKGQVAGRVEVMPQLVGLSLRKGLQRLNDYSLEVKIQGSGQIVSQVPGPGESLKGIGECVLTLASEI